MSCTRSLSGTMSTRSGGTGGGTGSPGRSGGDPSPSSTRSPGSGSGGRRRGRKEARHDRGGVPTSTSCAGSSAAAVQCWHHPRHALVAPGRIPDGGGVMGTYRLLIGDCREMLRTLPEESVHCVVTSPPYWGLRDYGLPPTVWGGDPYCDHEWGLQERGRRKDVLPSEQSAAGRLGTHERATGLNDGGRVCVRCGAWRGQLGLEPTPELYVEHMVEVFREVRRVLRRDGTLWLNLGDSYNAYNGNRGTESRYAGDRRKIGEPMFPQGHGLMVPTLKPKDLIGLPWRVAFALQADGWYLRSDIIWAKPNPMPESVTDRPTKAHEYVFLLSKSPRYYYDADAIGEPIQTDPSERYLERARI